MTTINSEFKLISVSAYDSTVPAGNRNTIIYDPSNVDLLRYRMGNVYNKTGNFLIAESAAISYKQKSLNVDPSDPNKKLLVIEPIDRSPNGAFSTPSDENTTFNNQPTINNWINSIRPQPDTRNISGIVPLQGNAMPSIDYLDLTTNLNFAIDSDFVNTQGGVHQAASIESVYNFYNRAYENVSSHVFVFSGSSGITPFQATERILPSYVALNGVLGEAYEDTNPEAIRHTVLYSQSGGGFAGGRKLINSIELVGNKQSLKTGNYYNDYSDAIFTAYNDEEITNLTELTRNQINVMIPSTALEPLSTDSKELLSDMPMYTKVSFEREPATGTFSDLINLMDLYELWSGLMISFNGEDEKSQNKAFNIFASSGMPFAPDNIFSGVNTAENLNAMDFEQFVSNVRNQAAVARTVNATEQDTFIVGKGSAAGYQFWSGQIPTATLNTVFVNELDSVVDNLKSLHRSYEDTINNIPAKKSVLYYKIEKWELDSAGNPSSLIQNFFMPNTGNSKTLNLYDTQVKYGKEYIYRIYAFTLIAGTRYNYAINDITGIGDYNLNKDVLESEICVFTDSALTLVAAPYFQKKVTISDRPPVSPDVSLYPYRGDKNHVVFLLKGNVGSNEELPISLRPEDDNIFNRILGINGLPPNSKIKFSSDDPNTIFDVFRMDSRPQSYEDFSRAEYKQITAGEFEVPCKKAAAASMVENLTPNKKYYYTFRAVDVHGNISNPSPVYEVEISYDGASPFLLTKIINFDRGKYPPQTPTKRLKKYIRIRPALQQTILNEVASGIIDEATEEFTSPLTFNPNEPIVLGSEDESLWGKTFKIRVISRKSGKKLDLNIKFENKRAIVDNSNTNNLC